MVKKTQLWKVFLIAGSLRSLYLSVVVQRGRRFASLVRKVSVRGPLFASQVRKVPARAGKGTVKMVATVLVSTFTIISTYVLTCA